MIKYFYRIQIPKTYIKQLLHFRICGCVAFIAVLFVNTTHAMELLTDYGQGHSHGGDDHDEEHDDHYAFVPSMFFKIFFSISSILQRQEFLL